MNKPFAPTAFTAHYIADRETPLPTTPESIEIRTLYQGDINVVFSNAAGAWTGMVALETYNLTPEATHADIVRSLRMLADALERDGFSRPSTASSRGTP